MRFTPPWKKNRKHHSIELVSHSPTPVQPIVDPPAESFESAITAARVDLSDVCAAYSLLKSNDPEKATLGARYYKPLWEAFSKNRVILDYFFGAHARTGAVLLGNYRVAFSYPDNLMTFAPPELEQRLWDCNACSSEANIVLQGKSREMVMLGLYELIVTLLSSLESLALQLDERRAQLRIEAVMAQADDELRRLRALLNRLAEQSDRRRAQQVYLFGMLPGIVVLSAFIALSPQIGLTGLDVDQLRTSLIAGGLGALVSVMTRTTRAQVAESLDVDHQAGTLLILCAGAFRPLVGGLFGLAFYVLVNSGLLPIEIPADPNQSYFYASIAFLAGFSERIAQDALVRTSVSTFSQTSEQRKGQETAQKELAEINRASRGKRTNGS